MQKILINGGNAVIGSQNFTTKGSYNAETSVQMVFDKKNQNEMNQFINDVLAESTFVTLNLLSEFNNQCNRFTEELLQLNSTLNKIDKIIEKESNSEKTKLQTKTKPRCKNKKFLKASIKRNNWKSAGAEGWYDTILISRENGGLIALAEASGAVVKKGDKILIFDTDNQNLIFGETHNFQISKLSQFGFASRSFLGNQVGNKLILTNHPNEGPSQANFYIMSSYSIDEKSGEETWQKDFFRFDGSSINYVESIPAGEGKPVDPESVKNSRTHSDQILFNSRSSISSGDDELNRPQPFSRHFEVGRKLEVWFELFLGNKPVLFLSTFKNC